MEGSENELWHSKDHAGGDAYTEGNSKDPCGAWSETRVGVDGWEAYVSEKKMEKRVYSFTQTEVKVCCPYRDLEGGQAFKEDRDL